MKIVYCLAGTFNSGGMERIVISKANWLADHYYDVTIITTDQKGRNNFFKINDKIRCIDIGINYCDNNSSNIITKFSSRKAKIKQHKKRLIEVLNKEQPDITISTFGNEIKFLNSLNVGGKKIVEIHFSKLFRIQNDKQGLYAIANRILTFRDKIKIQKYDAFICLTEQDKNLWGNIPNIHVIPNFIEFQSPKRAKLTEKKAIAVGRLSYQKGYDRMIEAWNIVHNKFPDWELHIYGNGDLNHKIRDSIKEAALDKCCFIHDPINDIGNKMIESSMLLLTSHYEGLPMALLEAMGCGLPVVSFDCKCGPSDIIENDINGKLVPNDNITLFAEAVIELICNNLKRDNIGKNAYLKSSNYLQDKIMNQWTELFNNLLKVS